VDIKATGVSSGPGDEHLSQGRTDLTFTAQKTLSHQKKKGMLVDPARKTLVYRPWRAKSGHLVTGTRVVADGG